MTSYKGDHRLFPTFLYVCVNFNTLWIIWRKKIRQIEFRVLCYFVWHLTNVISFRDRKGIFFCWSSIFFLFVWKIDKIIAKTLRPKAAADVGIDFISVTLEFSFKEKDSLIKVCLMSQIGTKRINQLLFKSNVNFTSIDVSRIVLFSSTMIRCFVLNFSKEFQDISIEILSWKLSFLLYKMKVS